MSRAHPSCSFDVPDKECPHRYLHRSFPQAQHLFAGWARAWCNSEAKIRYRSLSQKICLRTILLSGPLWAMASFGSSKEHSLPLGTPISGAKKILDAFPRTIFGTHCNRSHQTGLWQRLVELFLFGSILFGVVGFLSFPDGQNNCGNLSGNGELGQGRSGPVFQ